MTTYTKEEMIEARLDLERKWLEERGLSWSDVMINEEGEEYVSDGEGREIHLPEFTNEEMIAYLDSIPTKPDEQEA